MSERPSSGPLRPAIDDENAFFWNGVDAGELRVQQCASCQVLLHPPRPHCASCGSFEFGYAVLSGRGAVYTYATVHRPLVAPFTEPFAVVVVALEEGPRMVTRLIGIEPDQITIGLPVRAEFIEMDGLKLPLFRPVEREGQGEEWTSA